MLQPEQLFADRYRIVRPLAQGGMGAVFVAQHTVTEALVALKVLWPQVLESERARLSFELEAKIAARVRSDHIIKVLDAGLDTATRAPFLVMELLEGVTLAEQVSRGGAQPWRDVVNWIGQAARGLDAAHGHCTAAGKAEPIVHRDLKPENLFLTKDGYGAPLLKILDFGIARVLGESTQISREVRGTPLYMSSEQVCGEAVSPRTDVWALGLITYFLLVGRCYWRSVDRVDALFAEILSLPRITPSERAREDGLGVVLPPGFDAWLLRCIDHNAHARFASAGEAAEALAALVAPAEPLGPSISPQTTAVLGPLKTVSMTGAPTPVAITSRARDKKSRRAPILALGGVLFSLLIAGAWVRFAPGDSGPPRAAGSEESTLPASATSIPTSQTASGPGLVPVTPELATQATASASSRPIEASRTAESARPSSGSVPVRTGSRSSTPRAGQSSSKTPRTPSSPSSNRLPVFVELPP